MCTPSTEEQKRMRLEYLDNKKNELLCTIGWPQDPNLVTNYVTEYNSVMEEISTLQQSSLRDPIRVLPRELWEEIIHDLISTYDHNQLKWDIDQLIILACVSKTWENLILSTPAFWANLRVDSIIEDMEVKAALCLALSKNAPLNIGVHTPIPLFSESLLSGIASQNYRIRSIRFTSARQYLVLGEVDPSFTVEHFLKTMGHLPALEKLVLDLWGVCTPDLDDILRISPSIRHLGGISLSEETLGFESLKRIRNLTMIEPLTDVYPYLSTLTCLESVVFFFPPPYKESWERKPDVGLLEQSIAEPLLWKDFTWYQDQSEGLTTLFKRFSATMVTMHINLDWNMLSEILSACSQMKKLRSLSLWMIARDDVTFSLPPDLYTSNIQQLELDTNMATLHQSRVDESRDKQNHKHLFEVLTTWAPFVRQLEVITSGDPRDVITYAKTLRYLKKVAFRCHVGEPGEFELSTVEDVALYDNPFVFALGSFPAASKLLIDLPQILQPSQKIDLMRFNNLRTLEFAFNGTDLDWAGASLPNLTRLIHGSNHTPIRVSNLFFGELARHPNAFPALTYLGTRGFPGWDIVFIMLERRNFLSDDKVTPITTLAFPCLPASIILDPLTDRLRRKISDRPSNFDLSIQSTQEIYFDTTT